MSEWVAAEDPVGPNPHGLPLEPAAQAFVEASEALPYLYRLPVAQARRMMEELQSSSAARPVVQEQTHLLQTGAHGPIAVRVVRPPGAVGALPVLVFVHGMGWVWGNAQTHDRLVRELCIGTGAAVVFPEYDLAPEARYPTALEQCYATARWVAACGGELDLDPTRIAVAGDQMGGTLAAALTLLAAQRREFDFCQQVLLYPATDTDFDTGSYRRFGRGYGMRRIQYQWFWDQYAPDPLDRQLPTVAPLRAGEDQLRALPPALVITAEADCLRDEGEAYARRLREAGVPVLAIRYAGITGGFAMLETLRGTHAARSALLQVTHTLKEAFQTS
ncbi:alpha/beta hydrolase [Kineococcus gypseus]|uniref:alpha/beta hydrolase n=1 Tax=Kineococcus gypseus TaxID=1637102 RepID=UPI003D7D67B9